MLMRSPDGLRTHLRRYRLMADGMTQQELADRVGVTRQTILAIERGNYNPSVSLAIRLARVFGAPVEQLFEPSEGEGDD
jgi:putative transcriptional regulator